MILKLKLNFFELNFSKLQKELEGYDMVSSIKFSKSLKNIEKEIQKVRDEQMLKSCLIGANFLRII
ncbi:MAG: hypothetical protein PWQ48_610 [Thermotogaceae bacterium]|jgi:hypothetical protein|nr:hypothetical protein [Thermotogaceae bacterium]